MVKEGKDGAIQSSVLNMIDLAGSERPSENESRRKEGAFINKSLLTLGTVIAKLAATSGHVPYRDSKLTRVLQPYLTSNSNIAVILTIGESLADSRNTLLFGLRLKCMSLKPCLKSKVDTFERELLNRIKDLKQKISGMKEEAVVERCMWEETVREMHFEKLELIGVLKGLKERLCGILCIEGYDGSVDELLEKALSNL